MNQSHQLPPIEDENRRGAPARQALPPTDNSTEGRLEQLERLVHSAGLTRQQFEKDAILAYAQHTSFPMPVANMGDVLLCAQSLTDIMQRRGFFVNTPEFREVTHRVNKARSAGNSQQRAGDDPQGGDHKVVVSFPDPT